MSTQVIAYIKATIKNAYSFSLSADELEYISSIYIERIFAQVSFEDMDWVEDGDFIFEAIDAAVEALWKELCVEHMERVS